MKYMGSSFRPLTGISLFLSGITAAFVPSLLFSSPHGDFSFSIKIKLQTDAIKRFRPLTGISLFLWPWICWLVRVGSLFSSPHGDFSFSIVSITLGAIFPTTFSSPHGDFSFSMLPVLAAYPAGCLFSSPHGDFSFSIDLRRRIKCAG